MIFPWQTKQWDMLQAAIQQQRLPHALMLTGNLGLGKYIFAKQFSQYLLCENVGVNKFACGQCRQCHLFLTNNHPDFYEITPLESSKLIKIEQIRTLTNALLQTRHSGHFRIVILKPAIALHRNAANALLKTVEEPKSHTLIMLLADQITAVLPTIRSRCQLIHFTEPDLKQAKAFLTSKKVPETKHDLLLRLSDNAPLLALTLYEENKLAERDAFMQAFIEGYVSPSANLTLTERAKSLVLEDIFTWLSMYAQDLLRLKSGVPISYCINQDYIETLSLLVRKSDHLKLFKLLDKLCHLKHMFSTNINLNHQLLLDDILIEWGEAIKG